MRASLGSHHDDEVSIGALETHVSDFFNERLKMGLSGASTVLEHFDFFEVCPSELLRLLVKVMTSRCRAGFFDD